MMKKISFMACLFLIAATSTLSGQAPTTGKLASGTYVVYARSPQIWRVKIDPKTMANATISGQFQVTDGTPKNIDVLVFNEENYMKWKADDATSRTAKTVAEVIRTAEGNITAKLTEPGYHYLVISDRFEYEGKKTVSADIKFQYDKR